MDLVCCITGSLHVERSLLKQVCSYAVGFKQARLSLIAIQDFWDLFLIVCQGSSRNNACDLSDAMIHVHTAALRPA